jgi:hypothetical protein
MLRPFTLNRTDYGVHKREGLRTSRGQGEGQWRTGIRDLGSLGQLGQLRVSEAIETMTVHANV